MKRELALIAVKKIDALRRELGLWQTVSMDYKPELRGITIAISIKVDEEAPKK